MPMNLRFAWFFILILVFGFARGQVSTRVINDLRYDPAIRGASAGLVITDVENGQVLAEWNPDLLLSPASVAKLFSSGIALQLLKPDFRFETLLGYSGRIEQSTGRLQGNLVVRGGGDPTTGSEYFNREIPVDKFFDDISEALMAAGIHSIDGDILIDISGFQRWTIPDRWMWEDVGNYYGAGPSAVNLYDNIAKLYFNTSAQPGNLAELVSVKPSIEGVEWLNMLYSSEVNRDLAYVYGSPWDTRRVVRGTIPVRRTNFVVNASMPEPPLVFGDILKRKLTMAGIRVAGKVVITENLSEAEIIRSFYSPLLSRVCSVLNYESVNLIAESLVMQLSYRQNGQGRHDEGMKIISGFLKENITTDPFFLEDGSGLSRATAVSARQISDFLIFMHKSESGDVFKSTLPVAGAATLRSFSTDTFPGVTLRCKSGSMTRIRAYAGYLKCRSGREVAFAVMVNNFPGTSQEIFRTLEGFLGKVRNEL